MKYLCILIALFASVPHVYAGSTRSTRPLDAWAEESLERGKKQSAVIRHLLSILDASNVIVHIETAVPMPLGYAGMTTFVTSQHGYRYVRIVLSRDLTPYVRTSILGHELQHACEIANSTADSEEAVRDLFLALAQAGPKQRNYFETRAAIIAGRQVAAELQSGSGGTLQLTRSQDR